MFVVGVVYEFSMFFFMIVVVVCEVEDEMINF